MTLQYDLPANMQASTVSIIGRWLLFELILGAVATLTAVLIMYIHRNGTSKPVPPWLLWLTSVAKKVKPEVINNRPASLSVYDVLDEVYNYTVKKNNNSRKVS